MYSHLESREEQRLEAVPLHTGDTMGFKTGVVAGTFAVLCTVAYRLGKMEKERGGDSNFGRLARNFPEGAFLLEGPPLDACPGTPGAPGTRRRSRR